MPFSLIYFVFKRTLLGTSILAGVASGADNVITSVFKNQPGQEFKCQALSTTSSTLSSALSNLSSDLATEIQSAVDCGTLTIGLSTDISGTNLGYSDHDTIGLNPHNGPEVNAVTIKHEYQHVKAANAAGLNNDPGFGFTDPCSKVAHAWETIGSASEMCGFVETMSGDKKEAACKSLNSLLGAAQSQYDGGVASGCTAAPFSALDYACPECP